MKKFVNTALLSVALFAVSDNINADELLNNQDLHEAISINLEHQLNDVAPVDITEQLEESLDKALLVQQTDMLIASARKQLPENRFKVVFAD